MANEALVASLAPIGERVTPGSCLVVGVDGVPVYDDAGRDQRDPGLEHEARSPPPSPSRSSARTTASRPRPRPIRPPAGGTLAGNLYLVGGGDPVLGTNPYVAAAAAQVTHPQPYVTPMETLADQIVAAGVTRITGSVIGDDSRYDAERFVPSWPASYATSREAGPLGALLVNDAAATLAAACAARPTRAVHGAERPDAAPPGARGDRRGQRPRRGGDAGRHAARCRRSRAGRCPS